MVFFFFFSCPSPRCLGNAKVEELRSTLMMYEGEKGFPQNQGGWHRGVYYHGHKNTKSIRHGYPLTYFLIET